MASIVRKIDLAAPADVAWALASDFAAADVAFTPVLTGCQPEGEFRTVTFASGLVARERLVGVDAAVRRIAYAVVEGRFSHHNASVQVEPRGEGGCRLTWVSDVLPDDAAPLVAGLMDQGLAAFARNLAIRMEALA